MVIDIAAVYAVIVGAIAASFILTGLFDLFKRVSR